MGGDELGFHPGHLGLNHLIRQRAPDKYRFPPVIPDAFAVDPEPFDGHDDPVAGLELFRGFAVRYPGGRLLTGTAWAAVRARFPRTGSLGARFSRTRPVGARFLCMLKRFFVLGLILIFHKIAASPSVIIIRLYYTTEIGVEYKQAAP
ncbi:hypothetical protein D1872_238710 [compost metagenome]